MWKDLFHFTNREQRGILVLTALLISMIAAYYALPYLMQPKENVYPEEKEKIKKFTKLLNNREQQIQKRQQTTGNNNETPNYQELYDSLDLFRFNPNTITKNEWKKLGLNTEQIQNIANYLNSGGTFAKPDDLKKIYTLSDAQFQYLKPYIDIPKTKDTKQSHTSPPKKERSPDTLFHFDPNTLSKSQWKKLGIQDKIIETIHNYIKNGGRFYEPSDLKKIYGLDTSYYKKLKPYISIKKDTNREKKPKSPKIVELNTASQKKLINIYGIGDYYAKQIIEYRKVLGGYYTKRQLKEVDNFREKTYNQIKNKVKASQKGFEKININKQTVDELVKHPYINYYQAEQIKKLQEKHGKITEIDILKEKHIFSREKYNKIKYYIVVNK